MSSLLEKLESVVDAHKSRKLDIPSHVIAQYLKSCFESLEAAITLKDAWHPGKLTVDSATTNVRQKTGYYKAGYPCPECGGILSTGGVCMKCGFEANPVRSG